MGTTSCDRPTNLAGLGKQLNGFGVKFCHVKKCGEEHAMELEDASKQASQSGDSTTTKISDSRSDSSSKQNGKPQQPDQLQSIKPSRKRYFILLMFVILQMTKSFQWICLAGVTNMVANFYSVDNLAINWTTILFMVTFLILALPVSWIMDSIGLRRSVLIGSIGVAVGVTIKCFSCTRDGFTLSMIGHLMIGLAEPFFFSSYSQVASIWFPDGQVAMATAASLIGEQLGLALGFIIPPLMIGNDPNDFDNIQEGLARLFLIVAIICIINACSIVLFFDEKPRFAPGIARQKKIHAEHSRRQSLCHTNAAAADAISKSSSKSARNGQCPALSTSSSEPALIGRGRRLSRRVSQSLGEQLELSGKFIASKHFILLLIGFGMSQGISYSIHTLLNQMIIRPNVAVAGPQQSNLAAAAAAAVEPLEADLGPVSRWHPDETNLIVGNAGLVLILSGLVGSGLCGLLLDRYHKYKLTTALIYLATLIAMAALAACLLLESAIALYLVSVPLGFALTGYASCGFDYGVEITYPKPELLSSTLLNISAQLFGIPISLVGSLIVDNYGSQALGVFFCAILLAGFVVTLLQGGRLRRQEAIQEGTLQQQKQLGC